MWTQSSKHMFTDSLANDVGLQQASLKPSNLYYMSRVKVPGQN